MKPNQSVRDAVWEILAAADTAGLECPSIRAIRAKVGKGSLGTISAVVNDWKQEQLQKCSDLPKGFTPQDADKIAAAVWDVVAPIMKEQIEVVKDRADARIEIEHNEAGKVRDAADEVLAAAEAKDNQISTLEARVKDLLENLAKAQGALEQSVKTNDKLKSENDALHQSLDLALQDAAKAVSALEATQKLLPFIDPKHLDKVNVK